MTQGLKEESLTASPTATASHHVVIQIRFVSGLVPPDPMIFENHVSELRRETSENRDVVRKSLLPECRQLRSEI
jgi:hypothetical protein